jgi:hypothetical protein
MPAYDVPLEKEVHLMNTTRLNALRATAATYVALPVILVATLVTGSVQAQDNKDVAKPADEASFKWDARVRPRFEMRSDGHFGLDAGEYDRRAPGMSDAFTLQSRLGVTATKKRLKVRIQLQHVALMGTTGGGTLSQPGASVNVAYLQYQASKAATLQAGRMTLAYGDQRVLGSVGWSQVGRSWDGVRLKSTLSKKAKVDVFVAKFADGSASGAAPDDEFDGDGFLYGAYAKLKDVGLDKLDLYALGNVVLDTGADELANPTDTYTLGVRAVKDFGPASLNAETAYQLGSVCAREGGACTDKTNDVNAYFVDAEVGVKAGKQLKLFVGGGMASGDDPTTPEVEGYNHLYPTAHKFLGLTDVIGARTNVTEGRLGGVFKLKHASIRQSFHYFSRIEPKSTALGLESNTIVNVKVDDGFSVQAGYGLFVPDEGIISPDAPSGTDTNQNHHWGFLQLVGKI